MTVEGVITCKVADFGMSRMDPTGTGYELKVIMIYLIKI